MKSNSPEAALIKGKDFTIYKSGRLWHWQGEGPFEDFYSEHGSLSAAACEAQAIEYLENIDTPRTYYYYEPASK